MRPLLTQAIPGQPKICPSLRRLLREEKGSALVLAALIMGVLLSFTALVVDVGMLYLTRTRLFNATDAAALAGVQALPEDPQEAERLAREFAWRNGAPEGRVNVAISEDKHAILVATSKKVGLGFARVFGVSTAEVRARSKALVGPINSMRGVAPFGVERQAFEYGEQYVLKYGAGQLEGQRHGNFGALALGGTGAGNYRRNIVEGY